MGAEGSGKLDGKVTKTSDTNDSDLGALLDSGVLDGGVGGDSGAQQGSSRGAGKSFGDLDDKALIGAVVSGISTCKYQREKERKRSVINTSSINQWPGLFVWRERKTNPW